MHTPMRSALPLVCLATLTLAGCGGGDTGPLLQAIGNIKGEVGEILTAVEAGNAQEADGPMHAVGPILKGLPALVSRAGLPEETREAIKTAADGLMEQIGTLHDFVHPPAGTTPDEIDMPAVKDKISAALASLEAALPSGWTIPEADHDGHEEHGDHNGHGDHEGHDEDGHDEHEGHADHDDDHDGHEGDHGGDHGEAEETEE